MALAYPPQSKHISTFCTVLPCKLLFLQHKLTDISSIYCKKCDKFATNLRIVSFLQQGCTKTTPPIKCCINTTPPKQWHIYIIKIAVLTLFYINNVNLLFLNDNQNKFTKSTFFSCVLSWGMPLIGYQKRKETKRKQRRFFKMFQLLFDGSVKCPSKY